MSESLDLLAFERDLLARGEIVVGLDEVGRGALAGPMAVGAVVLSELRDIPRGLNDSKVLTAKKREALLAPISEWASAQSLGWVSAREIDEWGIRLALAVAANRAIAGLALTPTHALIDGNFNMLTAPLNVALGATPPPPLTYASLPATCVVKGDTKCATIAAAAVSAKVARDQLMVTLGGQDDPYEWAGNKGYGSSGHLAALRRLGPASEHRVSWHLPSPAG